MNIASPYIVRTNKNFINRKREWQLLKEVDDRKDSAFIVVSGRRRIGKTELIEQFFKGKPILKFEGIQPEGNHARPSIADEKFQIANCCVRLAKYVDQPAIAKLTLTSWREFFEILMPYVKRKSVIVYFEEVQWLASYSDRFTAELKPFWDDELRHNSQLRLVFSGSAPSFIAKQFLRESALYNRSTTHIFLDEFELPYTKEFLDPIASKEALVAQLLVGGVPEYLKKLKTKKSVLQTIGEQSFSRDGFFFVEHEKIFVSSLAKNKHYRTIIEMLAKHHSLTREEILKQLKLTSTGSISIILKDLEDSGFIASYTPLERPESTRLTRYCLKDGYLNFYYRFLHHQRAKIIRSQEQTIVLNRWISKELLTQSLGISFERWCRFNADLLAKSMKFDQIGFSSGGFFSRKLQRRGIQIDLLYKRDDYRIVVCEIKYSAPSSPSSVFNKLQESAAILKELHHREFAKYTIQYALIVGEEITQKSKYEDLFDYVVDLNGIIGR